MPFDTPSCVPVVGSRPSAIKSSRSVGSLSASSEIELLLFSLTNDVVRDVRADERCVSDTFPPVISDSYAGVNVLHTCPSAPLEKCGENTYGWLKSSLM